MNFSKVDDLVRGDHCYLYADDECYFLREYTARGGYQHSDTNNLISNFKKKMDRREKPEWVYKDRAIVTAAAEIGGAIRPDWLKVATLVPIPPSAAKTDPAHDDRMLRVLHLISSTRGGLDVRELVLQRASRPPAHESVSRKTPAEMVREYQFDASVASPAPREIGVFDDVLTTGCQFKAMKTLLSAQYPGVRVVGFFWARRVLPVNAEAEL